MGHLKMSQTIRQQKSQWVRRHRGLLTEIAKQRVVTVAWVSAVLYGGKSKDGKIEEALRKAGAPGMNGKGRA